jgi:hypothetical protein
MELNRQPEAGAATYVVISAGPGRPAVADFSNAGWKIEPLGDHWLLAVSPASGAGIGVCSV